MKKLLLPLFAIIALSSFGQTDQKDINEQVWKPFTRAITSQDHSSFLSVHSKDLVRVERDQKRVLSYDDYKKGMEGSWPGWKEYNQKNKVQYTFELRFTERSSNGKLAYEVGYFKNETINQTGERRTSYGKFQVALRKENEIWKILVDSDTNEGGTITEKDFLAAAVLE